MDQIRECRRNYLLKYYRKAFDKQYKRSKKYITDTVLDACYWLAEYELGIEQGKSETDIAFCNAQLQEKVKVLVKYQNKHYFTNKVLYGEMENNDITPEQIRRAKEYPFPILLEFKNDFCKCPFHEEKKPSMHYIKDKNRIHCFSCNKTWDTIDFVQEKNGITFPEAVHALQ